MSFNTAQYWDSNDSYDELNAAALAADRALQEASLKLAEARKVHCNVPDVPDVPS